MKTKTMWCVKEESSLKPVGRFGSNTIPLFETNKEAREFMLERKKDVAVWNYGAKHFKLPLIPNEYIIQSVLMA